MNTLSETIKKNPLAWIVQAVGILVLILNLWLASQLNPIQQDLGVLANDVDHNKESIVDIKGSLTEIKTDIKVLIGRQ